MINNNNILSLLCLFQRQIINIFFPKSPIPTYLPQYNCCQIRNVKITYFDIKNVYVKDYLFQHKVWHSVTAQFSFIFLAYSFVLKATGRAFMGMAYSGYPSMRLFLDATVLYPI